MKILIKNGRVIDPANNIDKQLDILIENKNIKFKSENIKESEADKVVDAKDNIVVPGLIDMHVHFREPGREDVETIIGGSKVAAKSGFTSVCTMPNTTPPIDNQALARFIKLEAEKGPINVLPVAKITKNNGSELTEMGELIEAGAIAFSDDGLPVKSSMVMRRALEYAKMFDVPLLVHAEDLELTDQGLMNEGKNSIYLGMKGIPSVAEEIMIIRDVLLAGFTKGKLHICHLSTENGIEIVKIGKDKRARVTCETAPHYFALTDDVVREQMAMAKMKPPLRTEADRLAIIEGLRNGTIDVIATDHAPHSTNEKMQEMEYAPFGIIGLETAVPLIITILIKDNNFSYIDAFAKVTSNPAKILNYDRGTLSDGAIADITIIDPNKKVVIDDSFIISHGKNTPFMGMELYGSVEYTICNGKIVYSRS